jgi:hypothetical protein
MALQAREQIEGIFNMHFSFLFTLKVVAWTVSMPVDNFQK